MNLSTQNWGWPQILFLVWIFVHMLVELLLHGQPKIHTTGEKKGEVMKYEAHWSLYRVVLLLNLLIAGGFFK
jgi:hypothetical protein